MYEKVVRYFEHNLCIENIYFRKKYKLWIVGIIVAFLVECIINWILIESVKKISSRIIIMLTIDLLIAIIFLLFIYILPVYKMYKKKFKGKPSLDFISMLMREEITGTYREYEIKKMEEYIKEKCKINNIESIDMIIDTLNEEIENKYSPKNFFDTYFNNTILPIIIYIFSVYFTNTNEQNLANICMITISCIIIIAVTTNFITKIKILSIFPIDKRENLLELKRVLVDIKLEWMKNR